MPEILASYDDVNTNLPTDAVVPVDDTNGALLQVSIARIVRGYLSRAIDNATLQSWINPAATPELIREAAAKLIAAQHYFNESAKTSLTIDQDSFAQFRYNEAMSILNAILNGEEVIPNVDVNSDALMSILDFFPVDDTDRAFTLGMNL